MSMMDTIFFWRKGTRRREVLANLAEAQLALDMVWVGEESSDAFLTNLRGKVDDTLKRIAAEVDEATNTQHLDSLADQIQVCAAKRAYWLDPGQIQTEAEACIRELQMWGVPKVYFDEHLKPLREAVRTAVEEATRADRVDARKAAVRRGQAALEALLIEYDYWEWYTDRYVKRILPWRYAVLGLFFLAGILFALFFAFRWHMGVWAVACAGLAGTCASILLKEEPLVVYRDMIKSWIWAGSRLMTGLVATVVGMGLLSLGFISVGFSQSEEDSGGLVPLHTVVRGCLDFEEAANAAVPAQLPDAGAPDALPASDQTGVDAGEEMRVPPRAPESAPVVPPRPCRKPSPCGNGAMLLVLGLAMLCGFSERAFVKILGQFEDRLGRGSEKRPPPSLPPPIPVAANPGKTGGANGEPAAPSAQGTGTIVTPDLAKGSAAARSTVPSSPLQRTPTSPGLPAPAAGPQPPKAPTKPSGT